MVTAFYIVFILKNYVLLPFIAFLNRVFITVLGNLETALGSSAACCCCQQSVSSLSFGVPVLVVALSADSQCAVVAAGGGMVLAADRVFPYGCMPYFIPYKVGMQMGY